jgi:integrase
VASLIEHKDSVGKLTGFRSIQYTEADGRRPLIRLGRVSQKSALAVKTKIEAILDAKFSMISMDRETAQWVGNLATANPAIYDKLARHNLVPPREVDSSAGKKLTTLGPFLESVLRERKGTVAASTLDIDRQAKDLLIERFGAEKQLKDISEGDVDSFRLWLGKPKSDDPLESGRGLSPNTCRKRCGVCRRMFKSAVRQRLIPSNPFLEVPGGVTVQPVKAKEFFVTPEATQLLLDNAPNDEFRLVIALARYGTLRCPSESNGLKWEDISWDKERFSVFSPKTNTTRTIPLFGEVRLWLDKQYFRDDADPVYVLKRYRGEDVNLRTALYKVIKKAGLEKWPKPFMNLRQSRAIELARDYPQHVAAAWAGHTEETAKEFYWRPTEDDFQKALQKALHFPDTSDTMTPFKGSDSSTESPENLVFSGVGSDEPVVREGLEPPTKGL